MTATTTPTTRTGPVGVGIIGAGVISKTYIENLTSFADTRVVAVGDLYPEAAKARAEEFGIAAAGDVSVVLDHPDVELVVNLTIPVAHAEVAGQAIAAGKHVWNEKPLALDRESGRALLEAADAAGLRVGCAPDTFLGAGLQKTRQLLEAGEIGTPLTALVLMQSPGPESWHPNPAFLFQEGAGPLFDIGPYYLTALTQFFGPVRSVAAIPSKARETRTIGSGPKAGEVFEVTVPSQYAALVQFESGQSATMIYSFDSAQKRTLLEVTGTEGTMLVPDPNMFAGDVAVRRATDDDFSVVAETTELSSRGTGALDMARAIREGRPHRAQGALAFHVLDTMIAVAESGEQGQFVPVQSTVDKPALLPADWDPKAATV
ncbi:Gfo/Idh/MocA family oxidoreductase [Microlunatus lacustris]